MKRRDAGRGPQAAERSPRLPRRAFALVAFCLLASAFGTSAARASPVAFNWRSPVGPSGGVQSARGIATPTVSAQARTDVIKALTGYDPSQLETRHECSSPSPDRPTCMAETIVSRKTGKRIHPLGGEHATRATVHPSLAPGFASPMSAPAGQAPPAVGTPAYLQQAYDLTYLSQTGGAGNTVAVIDYSDDAHAESDLAVYRSAYGLPSCTTANGCFRKVNEWGQSSPLPPSDSGWEGEITLDLDAVSAICPNCNILLVETNSSWSDFDAGVITADGLGAKEISNSYGGPGTGPIPGTWTFPGVATLASSGDWGSYADSPYQLYPSSTAGVTSVGGTMIAPSGDGLGGRGLAESAWTNWGSDSTGTGCVTGQAKPVWQHDTGCPGRSTTDVSAVADPDTGLRAYDSTNGWGLWGGTSLSSPLTAAYLAVTGIDGSSPSWAYNISSNLFDPSGGTVLGNAQYAPNGCPAYIAYICTAGPGYDGPTGIGSISGAVVNGSPGIGAPSVGTGGINSTGTYTQATTATSATLVGGVFPNGRDTTYYWQYGTTTNYGSRTPTVDVGAGTAPVATTDTMSGLSATTTYHYRMVATNPLGTTYGYDYTATTTAQPPSNQTPPSITGTAMQGQTLTSTAGAWTPANASFTWQWQRSADGTTWSAIPSATSGTYTLGAADIGDYVRSTVTGTTAAGSAGAVSNQLGPIASGAPYNTVAPAIAGTPAQGQVLTASSTWNPGGASYEYAWQRSTDGVTWTTIAGATATSYTPTVADEGAIIRASVTATNPYGQVQATSPAVGPVVSDPPVNTVAPYLSGTTQRTYTLSVSQGTWKGSSLVISYQWQRSADGTSWTAINGQTGPTYTLGQGDEGEYVRALVTASNPDGALSVSSNATSAAVSPYPPANTAPPILSGIAQRTYTLSSTLGTWTGPDLIYAFQWQHDAGFGWQNISGATASTYTLQPSDENTTVRVVVSATNIDAVIQEASAPTTPVLDASPVNQTAPTVIGAAQRGSTLSASQGTWSGLQNAYAYQWQRSTDGSTWTNIAGATASTYVLAVADEGSEVRVNVTASNADGTASAASSATATVPPAPPVATAQPSLSGTATRGQTLTATEGTWSGIANSYQTQWQSSTDGHSWTAITGASGLTYQLAKTDEGSAVRVQVTVTNPDGTVTATTPASATVAADPPVVSGAPTVTGTLLRGSTLNATTAPVSGQGNINAWQWQRSANGTTWTNISGATAQSYPLQTADENAQVRAVETASNPDGTAVSASAPTRVIPISAPVNTQPPSISGAALRGITLLAGQGTWTGVGNAYAYQWQSSPDNGTTWANIKNATVADYPVAQADEGAQVRVEVTGSNPDGTLTVASQAVGPVQSNPPVNIAVPIVSGAAARASTLFATQGTWAGAWNAYFYQWQRSADGSTWTNIAGATASNYTLAVSDENTVVRVEVTASNPDATVKSDSAATATVTAAPPVNAQLPAVSGIAQRASMLTATQGTWSGSGNAYGYQWQRNTGSGYTNITGATAGIYTLAVADENATVRVEVTATNPDGTVRADSAPTATVPTAPPTNSQAPVVSGTAQRSYQLTATPGVWGGIGNTMTYQWQHSSDGTTWTDIVGATTLTYTLGLADEGTQLRLKVTAVDPDGVLTVTSSPTATVGGAPPVATGSPAITGTAQRAVTLTATQGTWNGLQNTYAYQWQSSGDNGMTWTAVKGATSLTYTPALTDEGVTLRLEVTASNPDAIVTVASAPTAAVAAVPPVDTSVPTVAGTAARTQTLIGSPGAWNGPDNTYAYQWQRSADGITWTSIAGATGQVYTLAQSDERQSIRFRVTASNPDLPAGVAVASAPTPTVAASPPVNTTRPSVSGTWQRSFKLTATQGAWSGPDNTYAWQWQRSTDGSTWTSIQGATGQTYTLTQADEGAHIRLLLTAANPDGTVSAASIPTATVLAAPPQNTTPPTVSGTARLNGTLSAGSDTWTPQDVTVAYQWQRSADGSTWTNIAGANTSSYTPQAADAGNTIRVIATGSNLDGSQTASSQPTSPVAQPPVSLSAPNAPTGTLLNGSALTADTGTWDTAGATFTYQWMRCPAAAPSVNSTCAAIAAATAMTYTLQNADIGSRIAAEITATSAGGSSAPAASALTAAVGAVQFVNVTLPSITGTPQVPQNMLANPGTWSSQPTALAYQWQRCDADGSSNCAPVSTSSAYALTGADDGRTLVLYVTATALGQIVTAHSPALTIQAQPLPQNTVAPAVSGNPARLQTLTARQGSWANSPTSLSDQWERCNAAGSACQPISGATRSSYTLSKADEGYTIAIAVTAANASGTASAVSAPTGAVAGTTPVSIHPPVVTGLAYAQDITLSIASGSATWSASADTTYSTAWERCDTSGNNCTPIAGATTTQYTPGSADVGYRLIVVSSAQNPDGDVAAPSPASPVILPAAPRWSSLPVLSTDAGHLGDILLITPGLWTGPAVNSDIVQMMSCTSVCGPVGTAGASSYTIASGDLGAILRVRETASNAGGATVVWSARYVGPVISAAAGTVVLKPSATIAVRNTRGQTLATVQLQTQPTSVAHAMIARAAAARPPATKAVRVVTVKRAEGITGRLTTWICPVAPAGSSEPPKCTAKMRMRASATVKLPQNMAGKLRIVVVRASH